VWSVRDLSAARWYAPLMVLGYAVSLGTMLFVALPTAWLFWTTVVHRLGGSEPRSIAELIDTVFFIALSLTELGLLAYVTLRDQRRRTTLSENLERNRHDHTV
jgi:hypothetical protein